MKILLFVIAVLLLLSVVELAILQLLTLLWIPLTMLVFLIGLPLIAVVGESSLLWGLFDLDLSPRLRLPIRQFVVTLSAFAVASSAVSIIDLVVRSGPDRMEIPKIAESSWVYGVFGSIVHAFGGAFVLELIAVNTISAYFAAFAIATSWSQDKPHRPLSRLIAGALLGLLTGTAAVFAMNALAKPVVIKIAEATKDLAPVHWLGPGYGGDHWVGHLAAMLACMSALALYATLGLYGRWALGKASMVAALVAPLMVVLVLGWLGSALQFHLSKWHIPLFLVVAVLCWINDRMPWADHTYALLPRNKIPAASPYQLLRANSRTSAILVASAGGGIQAAAWTAKVLEGLHKELGPRFDQALCLISSISGGSMGSACYVDWLNRAAPADAISPFCAASASSLDEVAWGLAWPDLLRVVLPLPIRMDRAEAMEKAWVGNAGSATLNNALSEWNSPTADGRLPALVMNSTMVEVGGPLLLGTSDVNGASDKERVANCWWDGDMLHVSNGVKLDIPVVRGARLSATFPFVTPAARPVKADREPHMMDGGFYDNYGMATLTEWVDQALEVQSEEKSSGSEQVKRVLVLQINGFPPATFDPPRPPAGRGGWFLQLIDPIKILVNVRTAGQVSHRDVELALLQDKWRARGIHIDHQNFELIKPNAPLSWHLMPKQKAAIADAWDSDIGVRQARETVRRFLDDWPPEQLIAREEVGVGK